MSAKAVKIGESASIPSRQALNAYHALLELSRGSASLDGEAVIFALSWLVAGRLFVRGDVVGFTHFDDMLSLSFWREATKFGMPEEALSAVWGRSLEVPERNEIHRQALSISESLLREDGDGDWALFDSIWDSSNSKFAGKDAFNYGYDGNLCDLLFNLLRAPEGSSIWIPFDLSGQLVVRAVRRGLRPFAVGPGWNRPNPIARLLLLLEPRNLFEEPVFDVETDENKRPILTTDYLIACPPLGSKMIQGSGWRRWEINAPQPGADPIYQRVGPLNFVQLDRTDSWAIGAFWPAVRHRAVFMTLPNVLFARGQEQRLRESLVRHRQKLTAVLSLPARLAQGTGVVTALTVMDRAHDKPTVRVVDAKDCTIKSKSTMRFSRILDTARVTSLVFSPETVDGVSTDVSYEHIAEQDFNLVPSRYLHQMDANEQEERVALGHLVEAIRAPVASKDPSAVAVNEVGIPELDYWQAIVGPFEKSTAVQAHKLADCALREGDILLSIKGTIGKTGLIGASQSTSKAAVSSQSCVALRLRSERLTPVQLLLYLRSDDFRRQAEAFRVGVSVAHVTPATLLQEVKVPIASLRSSEDANDCYGRLCELEMEIEKARHRLKEIQSEL